MWMEHAFPKSVKLTGLLEEWNLARPSFNATHQEAHVGYESALEDWYNNGSNEDPLTPRHRLQQLCYQSQDAILQMLCHCVVINQPWVTSHTSPHQYINFRQESTATEYAESLTNVTTAIWTVLTGWLSEWQPLIKRTLQESTRDTAEFLRGAEEWFHLQHNQGYTQVLPGFENYKPESTPSYGYCGHVRREWEDHVWERASKLCPRICSTPTSMQAFLLRQWFYIMYLYALHFDFDGSDPDALRKPAAKKPRRAEEGEGSSGFSAQHSSPHHVTFEHHVIFDDTSLDSPTGLKSAATDTQAGHASRQ